MTNIIKNEKFNNAVKVLKCIYLCFFTFYLISREIVLINFIVGNIFITGFFMAASLTFIAYDLLTTRYCLKTRYFVAAAIFLAITIISCVINYKYGIFSNVKGLAAYVIYLFLLYPEAFVDKKVSVFKGCMNTALFTLGIYSTISIPMYFYDVYYFTTEDRTQGFSPNSNRLWGLYQDPNYAALFSLIAIFASIYLFKKTKSVILKILYVIIDVINLFILAMSGSRMGIVCFIIALLWISTVICVTILRYKLWLRIIIFIVSCTLSLVIAFGSIQIINATLPYMKKAVINAGSAKTYLNAHNFYDSLYETCNIEFQEKNEFDIKEFPFNKKYEPYDRNQENPNDVTNGRFTRWLDGLKLLAEKPFFGISPRNIFSFADSSNTKTEMGEKDHNIHNTYLEILAGAGIIGGIFVLAFLIYAAVFILKKTFKTTPSLKTIICTTIILMIVVSAVLLPDIIFFQLTFAGLAFWLCLGYCLNTDQEIYKNSLSYKLLNKFIKRKTDI